MEENKLHKSLIICVLVLASLSLCTFIKGVRWGAPHMKGIDLFADLRNDLPNSHPKSVPGSCLQVAFDLTYLPYFKGFTYYLVSSAGISSLPALSGLDREDRDTKYRLIFRLKVERPSKLKLPSQLPEGASLLKDFSPEGNYLQRFFKVLNEIKLGEGKDRIAFFGDSFIEEDIFCADMRNTLQDLFGGNGVGFVPITSEVAQYRNTIGHTFTGFHSYSVVKKGSKYEPYGPGGYCFTASDANDVTYSVNPKYKHLNLFRDIKLYYSSPEKAGFKYQLNNEAVMEMKQTRVKYGNS